MGLSHGDDDLRLYQSNPNLLFGKEREGGREEALPSKHKVRVHLIQVKRGQMEKPRRKMIEKIMPSIVFVRVKT